MNHQLHGGKEFPGCSFSISREMIDVTMFHRVDPSWVFFDSAGHLHLWFKGTKKPIPAVNTTYDPRHRYRVPTVKKIVTAEATDDYPEESHLECKSCGETIRPGYTSDQNRVYIPAGMLDTRIELHGSVEEFSNMHISPSDIMDQEMEGVLSFEAYPTMPAGTPSALDDILMTVVLTEVGARNIYNRAKDAPQAGTAKPYLFLQRVIPYLDRAHQPDTTDW